MSRKSCNSNSSMHYFKVGSLSWAVLPGKIMFRDVCYVTADYTVRIQDGYVVFRWWRRYVPKYDADAATATHGNGGGGGGGSGDGHSTSSGHAKDNTRVSVQGPDSNKCWLEVLFGKSLGS